MWPRETCHGQGDAVLLVSETVMHLNARSPLAGRSCGCIGRGCRGGVPPFGRLRAKPSEISSLKQRHCGEEVIALFEELLEKVP